MAGFGEDGEDALHVGCDRPELAALAGYALVMVLISAVLYGRRATR